MDNLEEQRNKVEDEYSHWRLDVENRLALNDPKVHADFKAKIEELNNRIASQK